MKIMKNVSSLALVGTHIEKNNIFLLLLYVYLLTLIFYIGNYNLGGVFGTGYGDPVRLDERRKVSHRFLRVF